MDEKIIPLETEHAAPVFIAQAVEQNLDNLRLMGDVSTVFLTDFFQTLFGSLDLITENFSSKNY